MIRITKEQILHRLVPQDQRSSGGQIPRQRNQTRIHQQKRRSRRIDSHFQSQFSQQRPAKQ